MQMLWRNLVSALTRHCFVLARLKLLVAFIDRRLPSPVALDGRATVPSSSVLPFSLPYSLPLPFHTVSTAAAARGAAPDDETGDSVFLASVCLCFSVCLLQHGLCLSVLPCLSIFVYVYLSVHVAVFLCVLVSGSVFFSLVYCVSLSLSLWFLACLCLCRLLRVCLLLLGFLIQFGWGWLVHNGLGSGQGILL